MCTADERSDILDALSPLVVAMAEGDVPIAMRKLPEDQALRDNIATLMAQAILSSSVDVRRIENGRAEVDWIMNVKPRGNSGGAQRRRGKLTVEIRKGKIVSLGPADFFASIKGTP